MFWHCHETQQLSHYNSTPVIACVSLSSALRCCCLSTAAVSVAFLVISCSLDDGTFCPCPLCYSQQHSAFVLHSHISRILSRQYTDSMQTRLNHAYHCIKALSCRTWMKEVLQPLNDKAANAIVDHIDLIEASSVDPLLLKLVAYVKTVRVMMSRCGCSKVYCAVSDLVICS